MAKDDGAPTAEEKGKAKAVNERPDASGSKADEKKDKDGKPIANGKKDEEPKEGTFPLKVSWSLPLTRLQRGA